MKTEHEKELKEAMKILPPFIQDLALKKMERFLAAQRDAKFTY